MINPILTGVSSAAQALEALFATTKANPASSSAATFSARQGLPPGAGASPQAAPSHASSKFAPAALSFLTALQDPESAAAGFAHGAEGAIGKDIADIGSVVEKLKSALTGASGSSSIAASALSVGSAAAGGLSVATTSVLVGALGQLTSALAGGGALHHTHHHHGGTGSTSVASASAGPLSLAGAAAAG